jgi:hypothetical protein
MNRTLDRRQLDQLLEEPSGQPPNVKVHRARATAPNEEDCLSCAGSGATASWAPSGATAYRNEVFRFR